MWSSESRVSWCVSIRAGSEVPVQKSRGLEEPEMQWSRMYNVLEKCSLRSSLLSYLECKKCTVSLEYKFRHSLRLQRQRSSLASLKHPSSSLKEKPCEDLFTLDSFRKGVLIRARVFEFAAVVGGFMFRISVLAVEIALFVFWLLPVKFNATQNIGWEWKWCDVPRGLLIVCFAEWIYCGRNISS